MLKVGIIGSRKIDENLKQKIVDCVTKCAAENSIIITGGAIGTDEVVIQTLVDIGRSQLGVVYLPCQILHQPARNTLAKFQEAGGLIFDGVVPIQQKPTRNEYVRGIFQRNRKIAQVSDMLFAFGEGKGTDYTCEEAMKLGKTIIRTLK